MRCGVPQGQSHPALPAHGVISDTLRASMADGGSPKGLAASRSARDVAGEVLSADAAAAPAAPRSTDAPPAARRSTDAAAADEGGAGALTGDMAKYAAMLDRPPWNLCVRLDASALGRPHDHVRRALVNPRGPLAALDEVRRCSSFSSSSSSSSPSSSSSGAYPLLRGGSSSSMRYAVCGSHTRAHACFIHVINSRHCTATHSAFPTTSTNRRRRT